LGVTSLRPIELDLFGRRLALSPALAAALRAAAVRAAPRSSAARDLSHLLERSIEEPDRVVALQRSEARELLKLARALDGEEANKLVELLSGY
jgi:hypothetical protein